MMQLVLPGKQARGEWMRVDTAEILKLFFFCERSAIISQAGWLTGIASFEVKTTLPLFFWQDALTATALRERIFELRYPSRLVELGQGAPLIAVLDENLHAPSAEAFILALAKVIKPSMLAAYREYLRRADELADGPTVRFLQLAVQEKAEQVATLTRFAEELLQAAPERRAEAEAWVMALDHAIRELGGIRLEKPAETEAPVPLPGRVPFALAEAPARDKQFHLCRYYWPDIIDPVFPYGDGIRLQLRSAVSHFNEVWAVETGGAILQAFAGDLPWEFIHDVARWTYDESRHTRMGYERLRSWGFEPHELPLGTHIYDSARGQGPLVRLGMLHYFETKNIGKKLKRAEAFASYGDSVSQHDMDFDWADETIHAHYGRYWYNALREKDPQRVPDIEETRRTCDELVARQVALATDEERSEIRGIAEAMIRNAEKVSP